MNGFLISFEGLDFSGKSLQANFLKESLLARKLPVAFFREPGGTEISERIREVLLDTKNLGMHPETEVLLYSAARAQIVSEGIIPHLTRGGIVICDRFYDSTTAYQGYGRQIDLNFIKKMNIFATKHVKPDLTFLLDLDPASALKRSEKGNETLDRLESETLEFHTRVREGYLRIARAEKQRFVVIDGKQSIEAIRNQIFDCVKNKLQL